MVYTPIYDYTILYDTSRTYDGWPSIPTGDPDGIGRAGRLFFDLLPDYVRDADTKSELVRYMSSIGDAASPAASFITDADPDTSRSGTSEPVNPATTPASWLGWLGRLTGVPIIDLTTAQARWLLSQQGAQTHGSPAGIKAAVQATLTGERYCDVATHVGGDIWAIEVTIVSSEIINSAQTLAAAMREKPAGANLTLSPVDEVTYTDMNTAYTDYADMTSSALAYTELRFT